MNILTPPLRSSENIFYFILIWSLDFLFFLYLIVRSGFVMTLLNSFKDCLLINVPHIKICNNVLKEETSLLQLSQIWPREAYKFPLFHTWCQFSKPFRKRKEKKTLHFYGARRINQIMYFTFLLFLLSAKIKDYSFTIITFSNAMALILKYCIV